MSIQKCIYLVFYNFIFLHKICSIFVELQVFISLNMIGYKLFIYFYDVTKIIITHTKIATFGYRRVTHDNIHLQNC
jgi:hypothetical protein